MEEGVNRKEQVEQFLLLEVKELFQGKEESLQNAKNGEKMTKKLEKVSLKKQDEFPSSLEMMEFVKGQEGSLQKSTKGRKSKRKRKKVTQDSELSSFLVVQELIKGVEESLQQPKDEEKRFIEEEDEELVSLNEQGEWSSFLAVIGLVKNRRLSNNPRTASKKICRRRKSRK